LMQSLVEQLTPVVVAVTQYRTAIDDFFARMPAAQWARTLPIGKHGITAPTLWARLGDAPGRWESFRHLQAQAGMPYGPQKPGALPHRLRLPRPHTLLPRERPARARAPPIRHQRRGLSPCTLSMSVAVPGEDVPYAGKACPAPAAPRRRAARRGGRPPSRQGMSFAPSLASYVALCPPEPQVEQSADRYDEPTAASRTEYGSS
jgi:hypothetical protein